ncbi:MAG: hypothetical protein QOH93_97 [Chloroflexia bacterium]|jgi:hypothetical protein|nr:hypothetical protein [Chloroflexia bacterium]
MFARLLLFAFVLFVPVLAGCGAPEPVPSPVPTLNPSPTPGPQPPADFGFIFDDVVCYLIRVDAFQGEYSVADTYGALSAGTPTVAITHTLKLPASEMAAIYHKMVEIDFFSYPDKFEILLPPGAIRGIVEPHSEYHFKVRSDGHTKELRWKDDIYEPTTPEADNLRALIKQIRETVESHLEVKDVTLPLGCA